MLVSETNKLWKLINETADKKPAEFTMIHNDI